MMVSGRKMDRNKVEALKSGSMDLSTKVFGNKIKHTDAVG